MAADIRPKLLKLTAALVALSDDYETKRDAIMAEIDALLQGGDGIGLKLARIKAHWCAVWTERHKEKCDFDHRKHTGWLKSKLLAGFTEDEICCKMQSYVTNDDSYYVKARHPFPLFMTGFNTWRGVPAPVDTSAAQSIDALKALRGE